MLIGEFRSGLQVKVNNDYYHSLYCFLNFDWLIYLQITACK